MMSRFHRPRFVPFVMSLGGVMLMFGLGIWQLQRLEWKEHLIATIDHANASAPLTHLPKTKDGIDSKQFYRIELTGHFAAEPEFHLAARYYQSQLGYSVFNPFTLEDGRVVLVNRGWIVAKEKNTSERTPAPTEKQTIAAIIRTTNERNYFTPPNQPEHNVWFGRDVKEMADFSHIPFEPLTLDLIAEPEKGVTPIPTGGAIELRNDHLNYAITWFSIGSGILVISLLYHRKKPA